MASFAIRKAHPEDTSLILQMIQELADFEQRFGHRNTHGKVVINLQ